MKQNLTARVQTCETCGVRYVDELGETCQCPAPMFEEPTVTDWEDYGNRHEAAPEPR